MNKVIIAAGAFICMLSSCTNRQGEHVHEHGPDPLAYTLYSDKSEIFVEFKPLVVGSTSKFAAHFTILGENFLPLTEGSVTLSLIVGERGIKQIADTPSVPGIYRLSLTPVVAGTGKLVFDIVTKSFTDQITIDNVKVYAVENDALAENSKESGGSDISYLKEQAWKVEFANAPLRRQPFSDIIKTSGQILPAPGDEIIVTSKASGIVLFSGNGTVSGSEVSAGTTLFTVSAGDLAEGNIDALYKEARANYEKTKADYDRTTELIKDKIVSQKDFLDAKLKYENAQANFSAIAKNYTANGQTVSAGMNGYVKNILVAEGQFVEAGTPLATISKNKKLILQANVSQKYFSRLSSVKAANFKTTDNERFFSTEELNGKVISYGKSASSGSPFIPLSFEIENIPARAGEAGSIVPGSVAEVYLKTLPLPDVLVIPVSALIEEQGNFFVYVQTAGESFQKREVALGGNDGINVELLSGVAEGERIVTRGAYQIKLSQASGTMPEHGHEH